MTPPGGIRLREHSSILPQIGPAHPSFFGQNFAVYILLLFVLLCEGLRADDQWSVIPAQTSVFLHATDVVSVTVGDNAVLGCQVDYDKNYKVLWTFNSNTLTYNEKSVTTDKRFYVRRVPHSQHIWDLGIKGVHEGDAGNYSCIINTNPPQRRVVRLIVKIPPRILSLPLQQLEVIPEDAHLPVECKAEGRPRPTVRWMKEDAEGQMQPIDLLHASHELFVDGSDLIIGSAKRWMEGTYVCVAENGIHPPARKTLTLTVQFRPVVRFVNARLGQQLGGITMLQCRVESNPTSHVSWKFNGAPMDPEPKPCTTISTGQRVCKEVYSQDKWPQKTQADLTIRNVTAADYGVYACVATSRLGTSEAIAELYSRNREETPPPRPPSQATVAPSSPGISSVHQPSIRRTKPNNIAGAMKPSLRLLFSFFCVARIGRFLPLLLL